MVGILAKRTDVRNQDGFPQAEGAHESPGVFADGGIAQVQNDVAGRDIAGEILDRSESQHAHMRPQVERVNQRLQGELGVRLAHQDHLGRGSTRSSRRKARSDSAMRLYGFRKPKVPMSGVVSSRPSLKR